MRLGDQILDDVDVQAVRPDRDMPQHGYRQVNPWLYQIRGNVVICLLCNWIHRPTTRSGLAKALNEHRRCGFLEPREPLEP